MISNIKLSGVAGTSMPSSVRAGHLLRVRAGQGVPARAAVAAAAGLAAAARVGAVAAAAPAWRYLPVANALWLPVAGIAPQRKRRTAVTRCVSVDWSPT